MKANGKVEIRESLWSVKCGILVTIILEIMCGSWKCLVADERPDRTSWCDDITYAIPLYIPRIASAYLHNVS